MEDSPSDDSASISTWLGRLKEGDPRSPQQIWNAYFEKLVRLARHKLGVERRRDFDEEDIALSAFESFFRAVSQQRLPQLDDRHDLWKVLVVFTARKICDRRKRARAQKRGGGMTRGESVFTTPDGEAGPGIDEVLGEQPTPDVAAEVAENCERLLAELPDDALRTIAQRKLEGFTNEEIAKELDCALRTVERKLERIRAIWDKREANE